IERIEDRHFRNEIALDKELRGLLGKDQTREEVALRAMLPVDEVAARLDLQGIGNDGRAAMGRGTQPDHLRAEIDSAVVSIQSLVIQCNMNRHSLSWCLDPTRGLGEAERGNKY